MKLSSVTELARYTVGDIAYWIIISNEEVPVLDDDNIWMLDNPRVLYEHGPAKHIWKESNRFSRLPKLNDIDFINIVNLLTSELVVQPYIISEISRSNDTGEFYYYNEEIDEWAQESCLFDTNIAARREKNRILKLIKKWASR